LPIKESWEPWLVGLLFLIALAMSFLAAVLLLLFRFVSLPPLAQFFVDVAVTYALVLSLASVSLAITMLVDNLRIQGREL